MPAVGFTKSVVEDAALQWFAEIGYGIGHGPDLEPGGLIQTQATLSDVPRAVVLVAGSAGRQLVYTDGILRPIPPVASTAGESGKPLGGGHPRVALFAFRLPGAST